MPKVSPVRVAKDLIDIAKTAMPETLFGSDSRVRRAQRFIEQHRAEKKKRERAKRKRR